MEKLTEKYSEMTKKAIAEVEERSKVYVDYKMKNWKHCDENLPALSAA